MQVVAVAIAFLALIVSILGYLARNRPYVSISPEVVDGQLTVQSDEGTKCVVRMRYKNTGEVPATDVRLQAWVTSMAPTEPICRILGAIFPGREEETILEVPGEVLLRDVGKYVEEIDYSSGAKVTWGSVELTGVKPELHCVVSYTQPPILRFIPYMTYETRQSFCWEENHWEVSEYTHGAAT